MITKNTPAYAAAQKIANSLTMWSSKTKREATSFDLGFELVGKFINQLLDVNGFAAQVAATVDRTMNPFGFQVARISDKQAWVLACAAVENGIEL